MKVEKDKVVVMTYELTVDGQVVDKVSKEEPFDYIQGEHILIPRLEEEIEGKEPGDSFECVISPADGYGEYDLKLVFDIPKDAFLDEKSGKIREDLLQVGNYVPMLNSSGQVCRGMVVEVKEEKVTMDFNPPMAGKSMHFKGEIIAVRDATEKELSEGLHGEFLPAGEGHCHGNCGGCHGGCGGGHEHGESEGCCGGHEHGEGEGCCGGHKHENGEGCCGGHEGKKGGCCCGE